MCAREFRLTQIMHFDDADIRKRLERRFIHEFPFISSQYGSGAQCHYENGDKKQHGFSHHNLPG